MMKHQLARPGVRWLARAEVHERHREQRRAHRPEDSGGSRSPVARSSENDRAHGKEREDCKAHRDDEEPSLLIELPRSNKFADMHPDRDQTEGVPKTNHRPKPSLVERDVK